MEERSNLKTSNLSGTERIRLDPEQESELREAFDLFDRDGDKKIAAKELHVVMQAIGRNMELSEVEANIRQIKLERPELGQAAPEKQEGEEDELVLEEFIRFISREMLENDVNEELVEAYRKFTGSDEDQGITLLQLKETMNTYGEKRLTEEEFALLFQETDADNDGYINFDDFVRMMMSR